MPTTITRVDAFDIRFPTSRERDGADALSPDPDHPAAYAGLRTLGTAAVVKAVWDLYARVKGKPLWKLLAALSPEELVRCIDFRYLTDALTPEDALAILRKHAPTRARREQELQSRGYPAYTTSAGWLGDSDEKIRRPCRGGGEPGGPDSKIHVGRDSLDDVRPA